MHHNCVLGHLPGLIDEPHTGNPSPVFIFANLKYTKLLFLCILYMLKVGKFVKELCFRLLTFINEGCGGTEGNKSLRESCCFPAVAELFVTTAVDEDCNHVCLIYVVLFPEYFLTVTSHSFTFYAYRFGCMRECI